MSTASDWVYFFLLLFLLRGVSGWRVMAAGRNVSSQETRVCRQGNESHGVTNGILHAWLVFWGPGRTRCTVTCFLLPSASGFRRLPLSK